MRTSSPTGQIPHPPCARSVRGAPTGTGVSLAWAVAVSLLVLYGSLLPFEFRMPHGMDAISGLIGQQTGSTFADGGSWPFAGEWIGFRSTTVEDAVTNIAVYAPVGFLLAGWMRRRRTSFRAIGLCCTAWSAALSMTAEFLQILAPERVASWTDVVLNVVGGFIGCWLFVCIRRLPNLTRRAMAEATGPRSGGVVTALTLLLLVVELAPFDFHTNVAGLHASFGRASWFPWMLEPAASPQQTLWNGADAFLSAAWFGLLAFCVASWRDATGWAKPIAWLSAVKHCLLTAVAVEVLQIFSASHTFELGSILVRGIAACAGAGWFLVATMRDPRPAAPREAAFPVAALTVLCLVQVAVLSLESAGHGGGLSGSGMVSQIMPFEGLWRGSALQAARHICAVGLAAGAGAMLLSLSLRRKGWHGSVISGFALTTSVAFLCQFGAALVSVAPIDFTTTITVALAAWPTAHLAEPFSNTLARAGIRA